MPACTAGGAATLVGDYRRLLTVNVSCQARQPSTLHWPTRPDVSSRFWTQSKDNGIASACMYMHRRCHLGMKTDLDCGKGSPPSVPYLWVARLVDNHASAV